MVYRSLSDSTLDALNPVPLIAPIPFRRAMSLDMIDIIAYDKPGHASFLREIGAILNAILDQRDAEEAAALAAVEAASGKLL